MRSLISSRLCTHQLARCTRGAVFAGFLTIAACANPQLTEAPAPKPVAAVKAPRADDAFRDFGGKVVEVGEAFRLEAMDMVGIKGHRIVIRMVKTEWTSSEGADGKMVKEGTADLEVQQGDQRKRKRIDQGETRTVFGAKITVKGAGEIYSQKRMQYVPWVEIVVN